MAIVMNANRYAVTKRKSQKIMKEIASAIKERDRTASHHPFSPTRCCILLHGTQLYIALLDIFVLPL